MTVYKVLKVLKVYKVPKVNASIPDFMTFNFMDF
jgi:hypothetical protein